MGGATESLPDLQLHDPYLWPLSTIVRTKEDFGNQFSLTFSTHNSVEEKVTCICQAIVEGESDEENGEKKCLALELLASGSY